MIFLDLSSCGPSGLLRVLYFFKLILNMVFVIIPIGLIIMLIVDFSKALVSSEEGAHTKAFKLATKRIVNAVLVFFVPTIINIVNYVLGDLGVDYSKCYKDINLYAIDELAAEEIQKEEAERLARLEYWEREREREEFESQVDSDGFYVLEGNNGCDGMIYYENGTFYQPKKYNPTNNSGTKNGTPETKGSAKYGYNKTFYNMLLSFINEAKKNGHTIIMGTGDRAWRSYDSQVYLRNCHETGKCNNGNLAAVPGTSNHGWGIASDLSFGTTAAKIWAHQNASDFGLRFSVCGSFNHIREFDLTNDSDIKRYFQKSSCKEDWHIQPASVKVNDEKVKQCR